MSPCGAKKINHDERSGIRAIARSGEEATLKPESSKQKYALMTLIALWLALPLTVAGQKPQAPVGTAITTPKPASSPLPKIWHSDATKHDFRVEVTADLFRAEWINIPPTAAKQGAYIRTECRRSGDKWIGQSRIYLPCAPADATAATKACPITARFEVDSITPEKISGRGESLKQFDCAKCQVQKTGWAEFVWVPKK